MKAFHKQKLIILLLLLLMLLLKIRPLSSVSALKGDRQVGEATLVSFSFLFCRSNALFNELVVYTKPFIKKP